MLKKVFNGDTAYITQLKQQTQKGAITFAARRHNVNVLLNNSTLIQKLAAWLSGWTSFRGRRIFPCLCLTYG